MKADRKYSRVLFPPADACALGPVTIYGADGITKIGFIPVAKLRKRESAVPTQHPPEMPPRADVRPTVPPSRQAWRRAKTKKSRSAA